MPNINSLTWLSNNSNFLEINNKIANSKDLTFEENVFCLSIAILLVKEFDNDKRRTSYLEYGYYLILSYSLQNNILEPLFDISVNMGFYPISKYILENEKISNENLQNYFIDNSLELFKKNSITETLEQKKYREEFLKSNELDNCYIAPTSFGKSTLMLDLISSLELDKVFIIVPTKSLLLQTYKLIKNRFNDIRVIFHDDMYEDEGKFIAVLTQERALRLLKNHSEMIVDALLIDEAHNLFELSSRSILLSRVIRRVKKRKDNSRIFYFSPLISDSNNLKFEEKQNIETKRIQFNIKEPDISEYRLNGSIHKYNRFLNCFFEIGHESDMLTYIVNNKKLNNFIYLRSPRKVEKFASILAQVLPVISNEEVENLALTISNNVHEEFYCVDLVRRGVLYIHGKLPDLIKEFLEYKFSEIDNIEFVVANSVILEGVNLPIDNLYILNTYSLYAKELINLIGRVNRLNDVFSGKNKSLNKLKPPIHFVNSEEFNKFSSNMSNKIKLLKSGNFTDQVKNPTLLNFDISKYESIIENSSNDSSVERAASTKSNCLSIIERENFLTRNPNSNFEKMKFKFLESGIYSIYLDPDIAFEIILRNINIIKDSDNYNFFDAIEKIFLIFIDNLDDEILDLSIKRLKYSPAQEYYRNFVKNLHRLNLKENINLTVSYFYKKIRDNSHYFYIGGSYGEITKEGSQVGRKNYINLATKNHKELVNLALVKIKMESDFTSYKLNEFVSLLKDYGVVSNSDYNIFIYGTDKISNTFLSKVGFSGFLINKFEADGQIENINIDNFGNIQINEEFKNYVKLQDDLIQFEIKKYISF